MEVRVLNYSAALQKLVADGGRIWRDYWESEEWRRETDRLGIMWVVAVTVRALDLPEGRGVHGDRIICLISVCMPENPIFRGQVDKDWSASEDDVLANDWRWSPPGARASVDDVRRR